LVTDSQRVKVDTHFQVKLIKRIGN